MDPIESTLVVAFLVGAWVFLGFMIGYRVGRSFAYRRLTSAISGLSCDVRSVHRQVEELKKAIASSSRPWHDDADNWKHGRPLDDED